MAAISLPVLILMTARLEVPVCFDASAGAGVMLQCS
jgi:hypothetical protein